MPSWGIGCFHLWLKDMLLETDTRSRLFRNKAERYSQLPQPPAAEDAPQRSRCFACRLPPLSSVAAHSPGPSAREKAVEAQADGRDVQNDLAELPASGWGVF